MAKQEAAFAGLSNPSTYHRPRPTILRNTRLTADTAGPGALVQGLLSPSRYRRKLINPLRTFRARKACYGPTGRPAFDFHNAHRFKSVRPSRPRHDALAGPQRQEKRVDAQRQGLGRGNPRTKTGVSTPPVWPYLPHKPGAFNHGCREDGRVNSLIASTLGRPLDVSCPVSDTYRGTKSWLMSVMAICRYKINLCEYIARSYRAELEHARSISTSHLTVRRRRGCPGRD